LFEVVEKTAFGGTAAQSTPSSAQRAVMYSCDFAGSKLYWSQLPPDRVGEYASTRDDIGST